MIATLVLNTWMRAIPLLAADPTAQSLRIMPMGDSITQGTVPGGYRLPLHNLLIKNSYAVDFVGAKTQSGDTCPDTNHWGQGGWQISDVPATMNEHSYVSIQGQNRSGLYDEMSDAISSTYFSTDDATTRNIVLLQIGINDVLHQVVDSAHGRFNSDAGNDGVGEGQEWVAEGSIARLQTLLQTIDSLAVSRNLQIEVILGNLCPLSTAWTGDAVSSILINEVAEYNQLVNSVIPTVVFENIRVKVVDQYTATIGKLADGLHPDTTGYAAMAHVWFDAITNPGEGTVAALPASLAADALGGTLDWDVYSDTWAATDALGRTLPGTEQTGPPRADRTVALLYFLWLGRHGEAGPFDITEILEQDPVALGNKASPLWGAMGVPHHWGESVFGHYVSDDDAVLRKHAQMLGDAGVDVIFFDVTNQRTFPESWRALGRVFSEERAKGNRTPQIAFLCPFEEPVKVTRELYRDLYQLGLYRDLWFQWDGKPLILADPARLEASATLGKATTPVPLRPGETLRQSVRIAKGDQTLAACLPTWAKTGSGATLTLKQGADVLVSKRFENLDDNGWPTLDVASIPPGEYALELSEPVGTVGWWLDGAQKMVRTVGTEGAASELLAFFTFRKPQPDYFQGPTGPNQWAWLEVSPQNVFRDETGRPEQMAVSVAQNALDGKLSVLSNPRSHGRSFHDGKEPGQEGWTQSGLNFAEQWKRAREVDPRTVFITGWNEWIAGRFDESSPFYGDGPVTFVDQFSQEFSRDIEPMKDGHGDAYFYQMVDGIRRYKGTRSLPPVVSRRIVIDGNFDDWRDVSPEFRDTLGDPVRRDYRGWGKDARYTETSGRHDLVAAKVSVAAEKICFYIRTAQDLGDPKSERWMWLFLDTNDNPKDGWLGFDHLIGRDSVDGHRSLERAEGQGFAWKARGQVSFAMKGGEMELEVSRAALGIGPGPFPLRFKWADHLKGTGDWSDFTLHGDCAPNDRYAYEAKCD